MRVFDGVDEYNVLEIRWMDRHRHPALPNEDWAWTYAYDWKGGVVPEVGALVDDLREKDYIDSQGYRITMSMGRFLHRRKIE